MPRDRDQQGSKNVASGLIAFLRGEYETFPDAHEALEDLFGAGDRVAARHRFQGTQRGHLGPYPPSNRVMKADYIAIYRITDGVIVESWAEWDNLSGLRQLGHAP
jgi:predicted ester cyclase